MTWREISAENLYDLRNTLLIDVRSPCEHGAENIPGSINVPLLEDDERAYVGTVYAQQGEMIARRLALRIISPKIPTIVDHIVTLRHSGQTIVVHCWRGGLRSESVSSFLALIGIDCWRLTGGYKAWRRKVLNDFQADRYRFETFVLHGQTGTGKTDILWKLALQGAAVLDLERLSNHRGSVFGGLGLGRQPSQKNFEGQMWHELRPIGQEQLFMEAESRKIGQIALPDCILKRIKTGVPILVTGSLEARTERIMREYSGRFEESDDILQNALSQLESLRERLGTRRVEELREIIRAGELATAVRILFTEYYDPLYAKEIKQFEPFPLIVSGNDPVAAATEIVRWSTERKSGQVQSSSSVL